MEIIEELRNEERMELLLSFRAHPHFEDIRAALSYRFCFRVHVYASDYDNILINSNAKHHALPLAEFPTLTAVIQEIEGDTSFFSVTRPYGQLSGTRIKQLCDELKQQDSKPAYFFLIDRDEFPEMNKEASYYVRDGMHHLVAYGLASGMKKEHFPIIGFYSSNKRPDSLSLNKLRPAT